MSDLKAIAEKLAIVKANIKELLVLLIEAEEQELFTSLNRINKFLVTFINRVDSAIESKTLLKKIYTKQ